MNKYENVLKTIGKVLGFLSFVFISLILLALPIVVIICVGTEMLGGMLLLLELCVLCAVHTISYAFGLFFLDDRYKPSGYVNNGKSLNWPQITYIYVKRNMITNLIECIVCVLFCIVFIILLCLSMFIIVSICGIVASIIAFVIFFLFYKKQQFEINNYFNE